jgi:cytochrome c peroxidase
VEAWTTLDLDNPDNYAKPVMPPQYLDQRVLELDSSRDHPITDAGATLGRVLFFDRRLSVNEGVACASCHLPAFGFTDTAAFSIGHAGDTLSVRTMRLVNTRWYNGPGFLWDRRAPTLEEQSTQPMTHPLEMGWTEQRGGLDALLDRMRSLPYYPELFRYAYGSEAISVERIQRAVAMYVRSIIAVRSRWDLGYAEVYDPEAADRGLLRDVPTLTTHENLGRRLFIASRDDGGFGCGECHMPPTFSLSADSRSNGVTQDETVIFKSPSLKNAALTGPFMHTANLSSIEQVIAFYDRFTNPGPALDARLQTPSGGQLDFQMTPQERAAVAAFLRTLTDTTLALQPRFSSPFRR